MDVVETIAAQPFAKPRDSLYDGPFFSVSHNFRGGLRPSTDKKAALVPASESHKDHFLAFNLAGCQSNG